jgi:MSHA biogenesis protein MshE
MQPKKIHLGKLLLEKNLITDENLEQAIAEQKITGKKLGQVLVDLNFVREDELLQLLSDQLQIPFVNLKTYQVRSDVVNKLPEFYARRFRSLLLKKEDDESYLVGMVDPQDIIASDEISRIIGAPIKTALIREEDLLQIIDMMYRHTAEISSFAEELSEELGKNDFNIAQLGKGLSETDAPVVKLLQSIFEDAVQMNASDIHIEPDETVLRIRMRVDGVLQEQIIKEKGVIQALTLRLKLMGGINITERRVPQDGRFSIKIKDKNFDVRLSTLPTAHGESVVMRLLNQSASLLDLDHVDMPPVILEQLRRIISLPNGLFLITGPTGSGKTTTLYGALSELNNSERKIITVEDPVEYRISRINQVQVAPTIDLTFARALRAILRQDPDIIMVGELRDKETVDIALRAAMTGHLVLSTLHTNDAISSTLRLIDMGAEAFVVSAVLRGIMAQRLVRRICKNCMREEKLTPFQKIWVDNVAGGAFSSAQFKYGIGCTYCHNTGYKGRIGVYELLVWHPSFADALNRNDPTEFARLANMQETFRPLALSALDFAALGITTVSEVMRIVGESVFENEARTEAPIE